MYITMCLYITITILLWVLSIYPFIKHYTIVVSIITMQFSHMSITLGKASKFLLILSEFTAYDVHNILICAFLYSFCMCLQFVHQSNID